MLFAMGFPAVGMLLYGYRPDSADARILVWRVCGEVVSQYPFVGVGTGRFAAYYMPAQAKYLMTATETTRRCSSDNPFAYNETLTVLCEQGIAGLLCVTVFWVFVVRGLKSSYQSDNKSVFLFPVVSLLVFSQLSFEYMEFCMLVAAYASHRFRTRKSDTLEDGKLVEYLSSAVTFHHSLLRVLCIVGLRICLAMAVASMD